jgi:hypothetical protein
MNSNPEPSSIPETGTTNRAWVITKGSAKFIVWAAGFGAAIATIIGWIQLANAAANPYQSEYDSLKQLGTSLDTAHFDAVLGPPALSFTIPSLEETKYVYRLYLERGYIVSTVADSNDLTVQYGVLSCDPAFRPPIVTPAGTIVRLNDESLADADAGAPDPERVEVYTEGTASTPVHITDVAVLSGDAHTRYRGYGLGISALCEPGVSKLPRATTSVASLDSASRDFRGSHPANFYVESSDTWVLDTDNMLWVTPTPVNIPAGYLADVPHR